MTVFRKGWDLRFLCGTALSDRAGQSWMGVDREEREISGDGISPWSLTLGLGSPRGPGLAHEGQFTVEMEG